MKNKRSSLLIQKEEEESNQLSIFTNDFSKEFQKFIIFFLKKKEKGRLIIFDRGREKNSFSIQDFFSKLIYDGEIFLENSYAHIQIKHGRQVKREKLIKKDFL